MERKLAIVLTARPSYAKLKPVIRALVSLGILPDLYVCASALLVRYGETITQVRENFPQLEVIPVYSVLEGSNLVTSVLSTGALTSALGHTFAQRSPALVVVTADRHETLAVSIAASYQNIRVAHLQGGELSGNIDDKVRNANTMLADYHFPATRQAANRIKNMRDDETGVYWFGCPSIDIAKEALTQSPVTAKELGGDGEPLDPTQPFVMVLHHPETENPEFSYLETLNVLEVARHRRLPMLVFWPGQDAGQEGSSKAIRVFAHLHPIHTKRTLPPERFLKLMTQTTLLLGNSSVGIRECSYLGTPVINFGTRQRGRERAGNVIEEAAFYTSVFPAHWARIGTPAHSILYGDGTAAPKIAAKLQELL